jgi:hypothetical protein
MEGLRTGDDIGGPPGYSRLMGEAVVKAHILCLITLFGPPAHFGVGFNANRTSGTVSPNRSREARAAAKIDDQRGTFRLR